MGCLALAFKIGSKIMVFQVEPRRPEADVARRGRAEGVLHTDSDSIVKDAL